MKDSRFNLCKHISKTSKFVLIFLVTIFYYSASIILNPFSPVYSANAPNTAVQPVPSTPSSTGNKNITIVNAKSLANNSIITPIIPIGNVTISKIPKPHISTDISNVTEQPEPKVANLSSFAFSKMKAETSNATTTLPKKQFSISPFVNNSLINNTVTNDTSHAVSN